MPSYAVSSQSPKVIGCNYLSGRAESEQNMHVTEKEFDDIVDLTIEEAKDM